MTGQVKEDKILPLVPHTQGGRYAQHGFEFQHYWAAVKLFELVEAGTENFLLFPELFEDAAIFDSDAELTAVQLWQVKSRQRGEWTWNELTDQPRPKNQLDLRATTGGQDLAAVERFRASPIGQLHTTTLKLKDFAPRAYFVSNAFVEVTPKSTAVAALEWPLSQLEARYRSQLEELVGDPKMLQFIFFQKSNLPNDLDELRSVLVGRVERLLAGKLPECAGLATNFGDVLLRMIRAKSYKLHPQNAATDAELKSKFGISKADMALALQSASVARDISSELSEILAKFQRAGYDRRTIAAIRAAFAGIYTVDRLFSIAESPDPLIRSARQWARENPREHRSSEVEYVNAAASHFGMDNEIVPGYAKVAAAVLAQEIADDKTQYNAHTSRPQDGAQ